MWVGEGIPFEVPKECGDLPQLKVMDPSIA